MTTVMIYESHPAVLAGLKSRLEAETGITVAGAFGDPRAFAIAVKETRPDAAIVGAFGPGAIQAAYDAHRASRRTKLLALLPGLRPNERLGYPMKVEFVQDGPRGNLLVKRVLGLDRRRSAGHSEK